MGILNITRKGKKQGENMATLEELNAEIDSLSAESRACDRTIRDGDSSTDTIEKAMTRKAAIKVRLDAVTSKAKAEQNRMEEENRIALQAEGEAMRDAVEKAKAGLVAPIVALFNQIGQIHQGTRAYDALLGKAWRGNYPYQGTPERHLPLSGMRVSIAHELVKLEPERFSMTVQGLVDKKGEAK